MGLFDSSKKTTTTQSSGTTQGQLTPWAPATKALTAGVNSAYNTFKSGVGSQPYTASLVTPFSQYSTNAFNQLNSLANQFQPGMTQAGMNVAALNNEGGLNALQDLSVGQLAPIAAQTPAEGTAALNDIQSQAYGYLNPIAQGSQMQGNPYLDDVIRRSTGDITGLQNLAASGAGRYGSGGHQAATQKAVGDMSSGLRFQDYNTQQGRMDAAIRDVFGFGNQANAQTEQDWARKMAAITGQFNAGQQQWSNTTALPGQIAAGFEAAQQPSLVQRGVGQAYEDLDQRTRQDAYRVYQQQQLAPWQNISNLMGTISGPASAYGTQQGQSTGNTAATLPGASPIASGIGGALAGGSMFANPTTGAPSGWGALLGGLGGFLK